MDKKVDHSYNQLHAVANPDILHQKIEHIGPLGLYKLGKRVFRHPILRKKDVLMPLVHVVQNILIDIIKIIYK